MTAQGNEARSRAREVALQALFAADRAFAADASARRTAGWVSWFDERGVRLSLEGSFAQGHVAIHAQDDAIFGDPNLELLWEPEVGGVIAPGELGFTRGRYELVRTGGPQGDVVLGTGTYISMWRWTADGWRVALDTGVPDQP